MDPDGSRRAAGTVQAATGRWSDCGPQQGELSWLSPDDVDRAHGVVHLRYQVQLLPSGVKVFKALKGRSAREVPLPDVVARAGQA